MIPVELRFLFFHMKFATRLFIGTVLLMMFMTNCHSYKKERPQSHKIVYGNKVLMKWDDSTHYFDKLTEGEKVSWVFRYKNTGNAPLVIKSVETTCGCVTTQWDKNPVEPGSEGGIEVIFDSSGLLGNQYKIITVHTNSKPEARNLSITAEVEQ